MKLFNSLKTKILLLSNIVCIGLLLVWIFKECIDINSDFTYIIIDFITLIACLYSAIRVQESKNGNFHVLDMVTLYFCNLILLFYWFYTFVSILWDYLWIEQHLTFSLFTSCWVFMGLVINFYATESQNMKNLDKIETESY